MRKNKEEFEKAREAKKFQRKVNQQLAEKNLEIEEPFRERKKR